VSCGEFYAYLVAHSRAVTADPFGWLGIESHRDYLKPIKAVFVAVSLETAGSQGLFFAF